MGSLLSEAGAPFSPSSPCPPTSPSARCATPRRRRSTPARPGAHGWPHLAVGNEHAQPNSATRSRPDPHWDVTDPALPVFVARGLTKVYQMGEVTVHALRGVDFDLFPGELVVLLGPSGSGKSTLLNILGGLDVPTSGTVVYQDHNLTAAGEAALTDYRRSHVGFVFQFYNLIPSLTARENVALVTEIVEHPMAPDEALALVGLGAPARSLPGAALGRRAAACRDRPGHRQAARRAAVRRADGRARHHDGHRSCSTPSSASTASWARRRS